MGYSKIIQPFECCNILAVVFPGKKSFRTTPNFLKLEALCAFARRMICSLRFQNPIFCIKIVKLLRLHLSDNNVQIFMRNYIIKILYHKIIRSAYITAVNFHMSHFRRITQNLSGHQNSRLVIWDYYLHSDVTLALPQITSPATCIGQIRDIYILYIYTCLINQIFTCVYITTICYIFVNILFR